MARSMIRANPEIRGITAGLLPLRMIPSPMPPVEAQILGVGPQC